MAVELNALHDAHPQCLELRLIDKLHPEDYQFFVPLIEEYVANHGKLRLLVTLSDFHGWDLAAIWEELKFDLKHLGDIELLAVVGDKRWEKWMTIFSQPFTFAEVRYFDVAEFKTAEEWILNGSVTVDNSGLGLEATPF